MTIMSTSNCLIYTKMTRLSEFAVFCRYVFYRLRDLLTLGYTLWEFNLDLHLNINLDNYVCVSLEGF